MITRLFGIELKDDEMDVEISSLRNGSKQHGQVEKIIIEVKSGKQYELHVKDGELVKEERKAE